MPKAKKPSPGPRLIKALTELRDKLKAANGATDRHYTPQQVEASVDAICDEVQRRKANGGGDA
jgi:hypothetical protein